MYCFFDPKNHDSTGIFINLGSINQIVEFKDYKLNRKIEGSKFRRALQN